jgi:hypothetical protein
MSESTSKVNNIVLTRELADRIIKDVGGTGQPPVYGFQFFTVGLEKFLQVLDEEYLANFIKSGGGSFKLVVGTYGGGKTHFLYNIRELAWNNNYVVAYMELNNSVGAPFHKLDEVYEKIVANIMCPLSSEAILNDYEDSKGIEAIIKSWYYKKLEELSGFSGNELGKEINEYVNRSIGPYESTSFQNAIKNIFLKLYQEKDDEFSLILQWLKGENPTKSELKPYRIFDKIDKSNAFKMIRCLDKWIKDIGYSGLIVLMDETDTATSLSSKQKATMLLNLRELVDACVREELKYSMFFYAVPDTNFLEGNSNVYVALKDRLEPVFDTELNPVGVQIKLEDSWKGHDPEIMLAEIGFKLAHIYEVSKDFQFDRAKLEKRVKEVAHSAYEDRFGDINYKRKYVQNIIRAFVELRNESLKYTN